MGLTATLATMAAGGFLSSMFQEEANAQQYRQNKSLMKYQNDLQMQTWTAQQNAINEYNTPSAQLDRLEDAGINPNAMGNVQGNYSSVSPEASVGLGSTNPQSISPDMGPFQAIAQSILQGKDLEIKREQTEINRETAESSIAVQVQEIKNMIQDSKKTTAETDEIKTRIKSIEAQISQKNEELRQGLMDLRLKLMRMGVDMYNSRWQQHVAEKGAATDAFNSVTKRLEWKTAKDALKFQTDKFDKEFSFGVQKYISDLKSGNIERFLKIAEIAGIKINGTVITDPKWIKESIAIIESFQSVMDKLSEADKLRCFPLISKLQSGLFGIEKNIQLMPKPSGNKWNYKAPWQSDYMNNYDMSDAF